MAFKSHQPRVTKRFRITYEDPETKEERVHVADYETTPGNITRADGTMYNVGAISAREWAEDCAYALADKGRYRIEEVGREVPLTRRPDPEPEPPPMSPSV